MSLYQLISLVTFALCGTILAVFGKDVLAAGLFGLAGGMVLPAGARAASTASEKAGSVTALLILAGIVWILSATGCGANARQMTLKISLGTLDAASAGFVAWDKQHQVDIVAKAPTREAAELGLKDYRLDREAVTESFAAAYSMVAAAAFDEKISPADVGVAVEKVLNAVLAIKGATSGRARPRRIRNRQVRLRDHRGRGVGEGHEGAGTGRARAYARRAGRQRRARGRGSRFEVSALTLSASA